MKGDRGQRSQTQMSGQVGEDPGTGEVYWCPGESEKWLRSRNLGSVGRRVNRSVTSHPGKHPGMSRRPYCLLLCCSLWRLSTQSRGLRSAVWN